MCSKFSKAHAKNHSERIKLIEVLHKHCLLITKFEVQ